MNLPNKLTVGRIILVPFFVVALLANFPLNNAVAMIIFVMASLTDMFDGKIARKNGLVTDFGNLQIRLQTNSCACRISVLCTAWNM